MFSSTRARPTPSSGRTAAGCRSWSAAAPRTRISDASTSRSPPGRSRPCSPRSSCWASSPGAWLRPLESALDRAREAEQRSRGFLADAAHQLRTPVAGVRAASEALLRNPEHGQQDRLLTNLAREAARTGQLLDALLRVARLDRGEEPTRQRTDLVALVASEVERQQALAPSLALRLDAPGSLDVAVDPTALREALANLLDNARRHARQRVDISVAPAPRGGGRIRVVDDGRGLEPGTEDAVFDRFVSLDDRGGSGLGLAIARGVARAHGGDVEWRDGGFELRVTGG